MSRLMFGICLVIFWFGCIEAFAQAVDGPNGQVIQIKGMPTAEDANITFEFLEKHRTPGGDGGSGCRVEPDHTITIFTGEMGHPDGSGGRGENEKDEFNSWHLAGDKNWLIIRGSGRVAQIRWTDLDNLRKHSL